MVGEKEIEKKDIYYGSQKRKNIKNRIGKVVDKRLKQHILDMRRMGDRIIRINLFQEKKF